MSKEQSKSHVKKGAVIDRRRNRTVSEGFAKRDPLYRTVGEHGVLERIKGHKNPIRLAGPSGFASVSYQKETPAEEQVWAKVGVEVPQAPASAVGLPTEG